MLTLKIWLNSKSAAMQKRNFQIWSLITDRNKAQPCLTATLNVRESKMQALIKQCNLPQNQSKSDIEKKVKAIQISKF